jgi:hypothetical protein
VQLQQSLGMLVHTSVCGMKLLHDHTNVVPHSPAESADRMSLRPAASAVLSADDTNPGLPFGFIPRNNNPDNGKVH